MKGRIGAGRRRKAQRKDDSFVSTFMGQCPKCGKRCHTSRKSARAWGKTVSIKGEHVSAYACKDDEGNVIGWHWGHTPRAVIAGRLARDEISQRRVRPGLPEGSEIYGERA